MTATHIRRSNVEGPTRLLAVVERACDRSSGVRVNILSLLLSTSLGFAGSTACSLISLDGLAGDPGPVTSDGDAGAVGDGEAGTCPPETCPPADGCAPGGCAPVELARSTDARGLFADEQGVFWTHPGEGVVRGAAADGSSVRVLFRANGSAPAFVVADKTTVYWSEPLGLIRAVARTSVGATPATELTNEPGARELTLSGGALFWARTTDAAVRTVAAPFKVNDPPPTTLTTESSVTALASDAAWLYIAASGGTGLVKRASRTIPRAAMKVTSPILDLSAIAVAEDHVYTASGTDGILRRFPLPEAAGGGEITYASGEPEPRCLAVDEAFVYWGNVAGGTIRRAPKAGGPPSTLAASQPKPVSIAVNSRAVFWTREDGVVMMLRK